MIGKAALLLVLGAAVMLSACGRPLAPGEVAFAQEIFGPSLDPLAVRVARVPLADRAPQPRRAEDTAAAPAPPVDPCGRPEPRQRLGPPVAFVSFNRINLAPTLYDEDIMAAWPGAVSVRSTLIFGHELVHVWQWQNRAITGFNPLSAAAESAVNRDPYFYELDVARPFTEYGYEQQASILQDYLCYGFFDPDAPRREELREILAPVFPLGASAGAG